MSAKCGVMCPIVGWARSEFCPECTCNPANAERAHYIEAEAVFSGSFDDDHEEPEADELERREAAR